MGRTSLGFKIPKAETVALVGYDILVDNRSLVNGDDNDEVAWNDRSNVTVIAELKTVLKELSLETGFDPTAGADQPEFGGVLNWKATGTGLHGASPITPIRDGSTEIELNLDGTKLGGELILTPNVVLSALPDEGTYPLSPSRLGARLWETIIRVQLEGRGSQFPTSAVDFAAQGIEPVEALWLVRISGNLESHFSQAVRLLLNVGAPRTAQYYSSPTDSSQTEFSCFLEADVVTQLLTFAFNADSHELSDIASEAGTFAEALLEIYQSYFPQLLFQDAAGQFKHNPSFLYSTILGKTFARAQRKGKK
ncbi:hypothetical protein [Corynebacterium sanguinis]